MDEIKDRKTPRWQSFDYNCSCAYFVTLCTKDRRCVLSRIVGTNDPECPKVELTDYGQIADKYIKQLNDFYDHIFVENYVIMPNHIHILLYIKQKEEIVIVPTSVARSNSPFSQFLSTYKRFCNKEYGENIWQARAYDHIIRNKEDYEKHMKYIYENPMRWYYDELYSE